MKNVKLARKNGHERTIIKVGDIEIGKGFVVIAGPCSVENEEQTIITAQKVKEAGAM